MSDILPSVIQQLRTSLSKMEMALSIIEDAIIWTDEKGQIRWCNAVFDRLVGHSHIQCLNKMITELLPLKKNNHTIDWLAHPANPANIAKQGKKEKKADAFYTFERKTASIKLYFETNALKIGEETAFITVIKDLTAQLTYVDMLREKTIQLQKEKIFSDKILKSMGNMLIIVNLDSTIQMVNETALQKLGYQENELIYQSVDLIFKHSNENGSFSFEELKKNKYIDRAEKHYKTKKGDLLPVLFSASMVKEDGIAHSYICVAQDIQKIKSTEKKLLHLARHDVLTDLPNRAQCEETLQREVSKTERAKKILSVMMIDIDNFKTINDSLGHDVGDQLLKTFSQRLRTAIHEGDFLARMGGDEFVLILSDIPDEIVPAKVAQRILSAFKRPLDIAGNLFHVTVSIGIAIYPFGKDHRDNLLKNADIAMYHAKSQGKNNFQFFSEELNEKYRHHAQLENAMHFAIQKDQFFLVYQPQINLLTKSLVGMEALIRWQHPELGIVAPDQFIPLAEQMGFILEIGSWVLYTACKQYVEWKKEGILVDNCILSVNVSPYQLVPGKFVELLVSVLKETKMPPHALELEITETAIMTYLSGSEKVLDDLCGMGMRISIDDFGTGYSSLSRIKSLPINTLKIDKSFIDNMTTNYRDAAIVRSVIDLSKNLKLNVIAEGVETKEQLRFLEECGCLQAQGFLFSKPLSVDDMQKVLARSKQT